jgi:hypothetical protein
MLTEVVEDRSSLQNCFVQADEPFIPSPKPSLRKPILIESLSFHKLASFDSIVINKSNESTATSSKSNKEVAGSRVMKFHDLYSSGSDMKAKESFSYDSPLSKSSFRNRLFSFDQSMPNPSSVIDDSFYSEENKFVVEEENHEREIIEGEKFPDKIAPIWRRQSILGTHVPHIETEFQNNPKDCDETAQQSLRTTENDREENHTTIVHEAPSPPSSTGNIDYSSDEGNSNIDEGKASLMRKLSSFGGNMSADTISAREKDVSIEFSSSNSPDLEENNGNGLPSQVPQIPDKLLRRVNSKIPVLGSPQHLLQSGLHSLSYRDIFSGDKSKT